LTGSAFTLVAPEDEGSLRAIERAINKRLPRVTVPDFNYQARPEQRLEVPHAQRIAEIRARKADERQRARANAERRARPARRALQPVRAIPAVPPTVTRTSSAAGRNRSASLFVAPHLVTTIERRTKGAVMSVTLLELAIVGVVLCVAACHTQSFSPRRPSSSSVAPARLRRWRDGLSGTTWAWRMRFAMAARQWRSTISRWISW
jgi:hypothetical protein